MPVRAHVVHDLARAHFEDDDDGDARARFDDDAIGALRRDDDDDDDDDDVRTRCRRRCVPLTALQDAARCCDDASWRSR